jgi:hypothetical protein
MAKKEVPLERTRELVGRLMKGKDERMPYYGLFSAQSVANAVLDRLIKRCRLNEAKVFLLADALLTEITPTLQAKRGHIIAPASQEGDQGQMAKKGLRSKSRCPDRHYRAWVSASHNPALFASTRTWSEREPVGPTATNLGLVAF